MSHRQKIYLGLAVSAGVCTSIALLLYIRHRRKLNSSRRDQQYTDINSSSDNNDVDSESIRFQSDGATIAVDIPGGCIPLTPEQAFVLTQFLDTTNNDTERLHRILTNMANSATFTESQVNLANAGCIGRIRDILSTTDNETTKNKILLALNNLALNDYTITFFSGIATIVINLCRTTPLNSRVRLNGLNLLINMSVLEYLHDEFMKNIDDLDLLVKSAFENSEETLSVGKILVNLSTNKTNLEYLLKLKSIDLQTIVILCTPTKSSMKNEESSKLEDILLRYITFYCNLTDTIVSELQAKTANSASSASWLMDPKPFPQSTLYFELFDHDKQMLSKSILRPQYSLNIINTQIKRLRHGMDTIRQIRIDSSVRSVHDEFNDDDAEMTINDFSTPKKFPEETSTISLGDDNNFDQSFQDISKEMNDDFEDDDTILASAASINSFCSANSTNATNNYTSPDRSISN
ncbi:unnamed protein product [Rotaria magnacalcarata]